MQSLREGMKELIAIKLWKTIEGARPNPWFCFLYYDKNKMRVNKETFAKALQAEGILVVAHYMKPMNERIWIKKKKTYGNSACPWMCSRARDINYTHCCPVAGKALEDHMTLHIHECWTEKEIEDTLKALEKVERAYSI